MSAPLAASALAGMLALGNSAAAQPEEGRSPVRSDGVLPSLSALLPPDSPLSLRFPEVFAPEDTPRVYDRRFPLGGQAAVDRGVTLPEPWGVSVTFVDNTQEQTVEDVAVALGKGEPPPAGTDLVDLPFVSLRDVTSRTETKQLRLDLWVLPFLNVFGAVGKVDGNVDLTVVADLDQTGLCPPIANCRTVEADFVAGVDTYTATLGLTGAYGWSNYFVSVSASGTLSFGGQTEDAVESFSASGRLGRRWAYGPGHIVAPYIGVSYFHLDNVVEGTTALQDAFPDGDSLDVRYRARISNEEKWAAVFGLNLGFVQGYALTAEASVNQSNQRAIVSATYRF